MSVSVLEPIQPAIDHTQKVLFSPFDFGKWLCLGFCSFLATLGEGGGYYDSDSGRGWRGGPQDFEPVIDWIKENALLLAAIVAGVLLLSLAFWLLLLWLSSRGRFMFLDGVARNRCAVVEPWREYRSEANSMFLFRVVLGLAGSGVMILLLGLCLLIAWSDLRAEQFGGAAMAALILGILGALAFAIVMGVVELFLKDFIVPVMYVRRIPTMEAWRVFNAEMLHGNIGSFALYVLVKILIAICIGFVALMLTCVTCCIAALPYISSVCLLPFSVFERAFSVYFLKQFGPEWNVFPDEADIEPITG